MRNSNGSRCSFCQATKPRDDDNSDENDDDEEKDGNGDNEKLVGSKQSPRLHRRLLRCGQCQQALYCSKECQKRHWKISHRKECHAWVKLNQHVQSLSLEEAHRRFQQAQNEIEKLKEQDRKNAISAVPSNKWNRKNNPQLPDNSQTKETQMAEEDIYRQPKIQEGRASLPIHSSSPAPVPERPEFGSHFIHPDWDVTMEEMSRLSSYQITLHSKNDQHMKMLVDNILPSNNINPSAEDSGPSPSEEAPFLGQCNYDPHSHTTTVSYGNIWTAKFPVQILADSFHVSHLADSLSIRLRSAESIPDPLITTTLPATTPSSLAAMKCCMTPILSGPIHRVLPLPEHDWDEVADYLICYNGQPSVDFTSSSSSSNSRPGVCLEDPSVIIVHPDDCHKEAMCVFLDTNSHTMLAATDSATYRGVRDWNDVSSVVNDVVQPQHEQQSGGDSSTVTATLCCGLCYQKLGVVIQNSTESSSFRLYKHRLGLGGGDGSVPGIGVARFIAHQLQRYAESKAVFTFVIFSQQGDRQQKHKGKHENLWIRTLTWDTKMACGGQNGDEDSGAFRRVVKVIYEIQQQGEEEEFPAMDMSDDPMNFTWGGFDACCLPENGAASASSALLQQRQENKEGNNGSALVRLSLANQEFNEFLQYLQGCCYYFPKEIENVTALLKLGRQSDNVKMAALPLL